MVNSQHEYQLRTNANYRDTYVGMEILRMARLVEALAIRSGLSIDPNTGEVEGLKPKELERMSTPGELLGVGPSEVGYMRPDHGQEKQRAKPQDAYVSVPDFEEEKQPAEPEPDVKEIEVADDGDSDSD